MPKLPDSGSDAFEQSRGTSDEVIHARVWEEISARPGSLLDLGCGCGEFLELASRRGWTELTGCDARDFRSGEKLPFRFVLADLNAPIPLGDERFEIVTAIEVIEHLENPRALVREIHRLLKPGGLAVVTTPNNESITSLVSLVARGHFSAFADSCYPAHITPLLEVDLRRILNEAGFEVARVRGSGRGRIPGTGFHWQRLGIGRGGARRFSDNLIVTASKPKVK